VSFLFPCAFFVVAVRKVEGDHLVVGAHHLLEVLECLVSYKIEIEIVLQQVSANMTEWLSLLCHLGHLGERLGRVLFDHVHLSTHLSAMCDDVPRRLKV
jgi:hypothetical protein